MTFDEVFKIWLDGEIDNFKTIPTLEFARLKGFNSIAEWRLTSALRLGMDKKTWTEQIIDDPNETLPKIIIGPYQGWSKFFQNQLTTSFADALEIPEFFEWCTTHDRINAIAQNFPLPTTVILYRKPDGNLIHIEGGHRICAVAYKKKLGEPIQFPAGSVKAVIADVNDEEIKNMIEVFLEKGTYKQ